MNNSTTFQLNNSSYQNTNYSSLDAGQWILSQSSIWPIVFWTNFVIGIVGNSMVVYVTLRKKEMRTVTNVLLLNLAVVDVLYLLTGIPSASYWTDYWPSANFMCEYILLLIGNNLPLHCENK